MTKRKRMHDLYDEVIIEEARLPQNQGELDHPDVVIDERNASCGDQVHVTIKLSPDKTTLLDLKWHGSGCVISQAAMSVLSQKVKGMSLSAIAALDQDDIEQLLGLEDISFGRIKCLLLGLTALKKITRTYLTSPSDR